MNKQNFDSYKFHCSSVGNVMVRMGLTDNQRAKLVELSDRKADLTAKPLTANMERELAELEYKLNNPEIPDTLEKYLTECFIEHEYGRRKDITNRYMIKGLEVEEASITLYDKITNPLGSVTVKNTEFFENEYICGTPDIIQGNTIKDIKSSWNLFTFFNAKQDKNPLYYWQLQAYMALTGCENAELAYCLVDTPLPLIIDEQRRLMWKMNASDNDPEYERAKEEIERDLTFSDIPEESRIHQSFYTKNETHIQQLYERIRFCRNYVNQKFY